MALLTVSSHLLLLLFFISLLCSSSDAQSLLSIVSEKQRPAVARSDAVHCDSWRLSVETNNAGRWATVPKRCLGFVAGYLNEERYLSDSEVVAAESLAFAETVAVAGDGKDVWVFDIDETLLSNLPYYRDNQYGGQAFDEASFNEWVYLAKAPALPASLNLYDALRGLGFKIVLLTGRSEEQRAVTEQNLLLAGYGSWERLYLRGPADHGIGAVVYKSGKRAELVAQGYRIHGSSGDQWSDLIGSPMATRSFKLPNPMYYIG